MFDATRIAAILRACGIPMRHATDLADVLGRKQQDLKTGRGLERDTTPADLKQVTPDARRHHLHNLDFRKGDPDYRPPKIDDSEQRRRPAPDPAVKTDIAPEETLGAYNIVDGEYTSVVPDGNGVAINLAVQGSGRLMMLDPPSNSIVGKTLRCEAAGGGNNQSLVRFFVDETGQEVVLKLQLAIERFPIIKDIRYRKGRGIEYTVQKAAVFFDPTDREERRLIPVVEQEVVSSLDPSAAGDSLIATKVSVDVLGTDTVRRDNFQFGGDGRVYLCKTTAQWDKGTTATLPVYAGTPLYETATGQTIIAHNKTGKVLVNEWVLCAKGNNGEFYLVEAERAETEMVWNADIYTEVVDGIPYTYLRLQRRKFWAHAVETHTPVLIPMAECVSPYQNPVNGGGGGGGGGGYGP